MPIIGVGGIATLDDVMEFLVAGASGADGHGQFLRSDRIGASSGGTAGGPEPFWSDDCARGGWYIKAAGRVLNETAFACPGVRERGLWDRHGALSQQGRLITLITAGPLRMLHVERSWLNASSGDWN